MTDTSVLLARFLSDHHTASPAKRCACAHVHKDRNEYNELIYLKFALLPPSPHRPDTYIS
jgi:hypothetical protein